MDVFARENHEEKFCVVDFAICTVGYGILCGSRLFQSRRMVRLARRNRADRGDSSHLSVAKAQMNIGSLLCYKPPIAEYATAQTGAKEVRFASTPT